MLEEDRTAVCGPRYAHEPERPASRAGTVRSEVVLGGRKVAIQRPRVRTADGEVALPTFQTMAHHDPLDRRVGPGVDQQVDQGQMTQRGFVLGNGMGYARLRFHGGSLSVRLTPRAWSPLVYHEQRGAAAFNFQQLLGHLLTPCRRQKRTLRPGRFLR